MQTRYPGTLSAARGVGTFLAVDAPTDVKRDGYISALKALGINAGVSRLLTIMKISNAKMIFILHSFNTMPTSQIRWTSTAVNGIIFMQ